MTPEIYRLASGLFDEALSASPADPASWVEASVADPAAKQEALRLLSLHREVEKAGFLEAQIARHRASWSKTQLPSGALVAGRYNVESLIGEGGMGEVYAVFDQELSQRVALKTLHAHMAADPVALERFRREVLLLREIQHPSVIRILDFGRDEDRYFYTMELLEGRTLAERLRAEGPIAESEVHSLAHAILDGLEAVHARDIVHRDLKPSNVFQTNDGRTVLMDFGIATTPGQSTLTQTESVLGSLDYMSPEQLEGQSVTAASDYYSFALLVYELRVAAQPWSGTSPVARAFRRLHEPKLPKPLPGALGRTIHACLQKSPSARPASIAAIRALLGGQRLVPWKQLTLAAALVLVAFLAWNFWPRTEPVDPQVAQHLKLAAQFAARRTADDTENARKEFEAAIRLAPNNAEAWTGLAEVYSTMSNFGYDDAKPALLKAKTAARRAIELASDSGVAHAVFAYIVSLDLENWRLADPLFVKAVTLDPSQPRTRLWYGAFLGKVGRFPEALSQLQAGLELDPGSMALNQQLVSTHTASRDYPLAIASSEALVRLHPREPSAHLALCNTLLFAGQAAKARLACEESLRLDASPAARAVYASVLAALGRRSEARAIARKVEAKARNVSILADLYHRLGEDEKAVSLLEAAYAVGDSTIQYIGFSPRFDGLSSLPQVQSIRRNLGFTTAARP